MIYLNFNCINVVHFYLGTFRERIQQHISRFSAGVKKKFRSGKRGLPGTQCNQKLLSVEEKISLLQYIYSKVSK